MPVGDDPYTSIIPTKNTTLSSLYAAIVFLYFILILHGYGAIAEILTMEDNTIFTCNTDSYSKSVDKFC